MALLNKTQEEYYLGPDGNWDSLDEGYGSYQFISLEDIISNFIVAYVGESKLITKLKRSDVAFHAQRGIAELSFDVMTSFKSQEIEVPPSLGMVLPHDYVNYVKMTWMDSTGKERIIYPSSKTSNPLPILQDNNYEYLYDGAGQILTASESQTKKTFREMPYADVDVNSLTGTEQRDLYFGQRFGIDPETSQSNGVFIIDQIKGMIYFSSNIVNKIITLKYISDSLATDGEIKVHKFAEEALYKHIALAVLSTRANTPEYIINRFKKEKRAATRNAKIRLSNIKISEMEQVMRGKSKQIKH